MPKFSATLNLPKYATAPTSPTPVDGDVYYNTTDNAVYSRINGAWVDLAAGTSDPSFSTVRITSTTDATTTSTLHGLQIGATSSFNLRLSRGSVQAVSNGNGNTSLAIQPNGGIVEIGANTATNVAVNKGAGIRFVTATGSSSNGYVELKAPSSVSGTLSFSLPSSDGSANQVLATDGAGNLSWASTASSTVSINAQTGTTYTLVLADAGKLITLGNAASITLTIPLNATVAFPIGTTIDLLQILAGQVTVAITATGVLNTFDSRTKLGGQWAAATIIKTDTNTWALIGNVTS